MPPNDSPVLWSALHQCLAEVTGRAELPEAKRVRVETFIGDQLIRGHSPARIVDDVVAKLRAGGF
jgi:hypothetical protein